MSPSASSITTLPEDVRQTLVHIKWCVFGLWSFGAVYFVLQPLSALSTLVLAIFGTFLLHEDPQMTPCYNSLREMVGQCCGNGGMTMLAPFVVFSVVNAVLDGFQLAQLFYLFGGRMFTSPIVDILVGIWVFETAAAVLSWRVLKAVAPTLPEPGGDYQRLGGGAPPRPGGPAPQAGQTMGPPPRQRATSSRLLGRATD
eukprot:CAMPEP_0176222126 /NCGR_PEP_ID=MMETSP0121_2-20121125/20073_1 /TAXON_ID=160619 /ORGANISM="Kryptoperidinium foliaceum, Strain CCMP 1326" /LENGTH=198 /DNA_ID=CAMNT_0017561329 /DNA_START=27 /DNA_END=623 /DNA_ORIENTATION=-